MRRYFAVWLLCALVLLGMAPSNFALSVLAQPAPNPLPLADELGSGWVAVPDTRPTGGPDYPEAYGWYVGPEGSRVILSVSRPHARILNSIWQEIAQAIDSDSSLHRRDHFSPNMPPIAGCTDVRRVESDDETFPLLREATTVCRTDDSIVRAQISGRWNELKGVVASDALAQRLLAVHDRPAQHAPIRTAVDLKTLFPTADQLPAGMMLVEEGARTLDEVAAGFPDPADARNVLETYGWAENAYRVYTAPATDATTHPNGPIRLEISLHQFTAGSTVGCATCGTGFALPYFAHGRAVALGERETIGLGTTPCELEVVGARGEESTVYLRSGAVLTRITVEQSRGQWATAYYTTMPIAVDLATAILQNAGTSREVLRQTCE